MNSTLTKVLLSATIIATVYVVGCSDVKFGYEPSATCQDFQGTCEKELDFNRYTFSFKMGSVSILVIDDNSSSMYPEQEKMGEKFPNFIKAISPLDWELAITTTDVESKNPQRGRLLPFSDNPNEVVLWSGSIDADEKFKKTIKRNETLNCDPKVQSTCPSGDERAIYAANLIIDQGHPDFFTKDHIAFVILSDEDERSNGGRSSRGGQSSRNLDEYDLPETLVSKVKEQLGSEKTFSVHPIIVESGDKDCYDTQSDQLSCRDEGGNLIIVSPGDTRCVANTSSRKFKAFYGTVYEQLANPSASLKSMGGIVNGQTGSICAPDYGELLESIGEKIVTNTQIKKLPCSPENPEDLVLSFSPNLGADFEVNYSVDQNNFLTINPIDPIPAGTRVSVSILCPLYI